jgi:D-glycero-D-manno-heptose 1,7-bisphosphate phosphatase
MFLSALLACPLRDSAHPGIETSKGMAGEKRKALFLDRDGIINEDTGYPHKPEQIRFIDAVFPLCKTAADKGYLLIVITNQAGVAKGKFPEDDVRSLHDWMTIEFRKRGIDIAGFYYCPHHAEAIVPEYRVTCNCRKPKPGLVERAIKDFNIDVRESFVVGDKSSDRIALDGLRSIIVKSRYMPEGFDVEELALAAGYLV